MAMTTNTTDSWDDASLQSAAHLTSANDLSAPTSERPEEQAPQRMPSEIVAAMQQGYQATLAERQVLNAEWQAVDGENWPD